MKGRFFDYTTNIRRASGSVQAWNMLIANALSNTTARYIDKKMTAWMSSAVKSDSKDLSVILRLHTA